MDKIGSPLLQAIASVRESAGNPEQEKKDAERTAELVAKSIQVSIELGKSLELKDEDAQSDAVRVALAGICAPLVAHHYSITKNSPADADLDKVIKSLQAVLIFADKFNIDEKDVARIEQTHTGIFCDETQLTVQYIHALTPMINAISRFSFGQEPSTLIQNIASKLTDRTEKLRTSVIGGTPDEYQTKQIELTLLRTLSELYAACHNEQTDDLTANKDLSANADTIWEKFEVRVSMMDALASGMGGETTQNSAPTPTAPQAAAPATAPTPPPSESATQPAPETPAPAENSGGGDGSPFSSFAKKEDAAPTEAAPTPAAEPAPETPPAEPTPQPTEAAPEAPAEEKEEPKESGASPFSSFVKKDSEE